MRAFLDGEIKMLRTTYYLDAIEESPAPSPIETPSLHPLTPTLISPPSQPPTPHWTMKESSPECDLHDENAAPYISLHEAVRPRRPKARTRTLESIAEVMAIKQVVEEQAPVERETVGIRALKMLMARYHRAGRPWIFGVEPVEVWVEEWNQAPTGVGEEGDLK